MRRFTHVLLHFLARLACVRHAASVDSEPGSNSRLKPDHLCPDPEGSRTEYLFESLELKPELPSQYDWHVQPDCQRPNRDPPERHVLVEFTSRYTVAIRLSSKPFKLTNPLHTLSTQPAGGFLQSIKRTVRSAVFERTW